MADKTKVQLKQELAEAHQRIAELERLAAEPKPEEDMAQASESLSEVLDREQRMLQAVLDNIPAGVFVAEAPTGKPLLANKQAQELLGQGISPEAAKEELAEVYSAYRYGTDELYPATEMPLVRGMSGERTMVDDMEIRKPDGESILLQVFGAPIHDASGEVTSSVAIFQDITERKQAAAQIEAEVAERTKEVAAFRALAENATDAILIGTLDSTITYANRATYELFEYDHEQQELLGALISDLTPMKEKKFLAEEILPTVKKTGSWQGESKRQRKDGTIFEAYVTTFTLQDEAGQPSALVAIIRDITKQKQAETEREHLHQELIDAQRRAIQELSTPVIPVMERIIVLPLVGSIDSMRARDITRSLLAGISAHRAKVVILDVTGVSIMDTGIVNHLNKTIQAARLKGARTIVTGVSDAVAESIVDLGIDWSEITTLSTLQIGLVTALNSLGIKLSK